MARTTARRTKHEARAPRRAAVRARFAVGFVGGGNMATALLRGFLKAGLYEPGQMIVSDVDPARLRALKRSLRVAVTSDNAAVVRSSKVVVLAIKPQVLDAMLAGLGDAAAARPLFVSILAGASTARLERGLGTGARVVRVMPNTPALLGEGMAVAVRGRNATPADERLTLRLMRAVGTARAVRDERLLDAVTGLSGSGPAYVYLFAEALIAGGVAAGLAPDVAEELALQTILGAAVMLRRAGERPERLREMVTSPGGTTLAGLQELGRRGFSEAVVHAVLAATRRSHELGKG